MKLSVVNTGYFKLDGGAMFGVVPKKLWIKTNEPDQNNLCTWAMRSLLIEDGDKLILIDTGIGNKQTDKFFSHYHLHGEDSLQSSITKSGYSLDDVTDVSVSSPQKGHTLVYTGSGWVIGQTPVSQFVVTANGSSAYRFGGAGFPAGTSGDNPDLHIKKGHTYYFRNTSSGHPFEIRSSAGGLSLIHI